MWQWYFSLIPDWLLVWIYYALIASGAFLWAASKFIKIIPFVNKYRFLSEILGIVLFTLGVFSYGGMVVESAWKEKVASAEENVKKIEAQSDEFNKQLDQERKKKAKVRVEYYATVKERIKEVEKVIDAGCKLAPEVAEIHNKAAQGPAK